MGTGPLMRWQRGWAWAFRYDGMFPARCSASFRAYHVGVSGIDPVFENC